MREFDHTPEEALSTLRWPLRLTRAGMVAERLTRAFWPFWTIVLAVLAALAFGAHETLSVGALWTGLGLSGAAMIAALIFGFRAFHWPRAEEALDRLDHTLPGRPITALGDAQAIGAGDTGSQAVWRVHLARMAERVQGAKPVAPDLTLSRRDPYGLRYLALTGFVAALVFGSLWRVAELPAAATAPGAALAAGPAWEGWVEPPAYTALPSLYLNDIRDGALTVPKGSRVTLRLYGEVGALNVSETVSGRSAPAPEDGPEMARSFDVAQAGEIVVDGQGGQSWQIALSPDTVPEVAFQGPMIRRASGELEQGYVAKDDYGVTAGQITIALDLPALPRRYGLGAEPEPREPIVLDLPLPLSGDRRDFSEMIIEDLSEHPWVGLPVTIALSAEDAQGQQGRSEPLSTPLPGLRFFDPLANALIEQRRDLLWTRENGRRVVQVLRAISHEPDGLFRDSSLFLQFRAAQRQLETGVEAGLTPELRDEVAKALWDISLLIEYGDLDDALERLQRAQERLSEAMRNGASDEEIAELMREMQEAMRDYIRELAEQSQRDGNQQAQNQENMQTITGDQLQQMMDRIEELMKEGRMAEAQQLMQQLQQMLENMQVTQGQGGEGQSPGQQALDGLAETLRDQQGLSDQAFRDLQEQFNPNDQAGQSGQNEGRNGGQGRGQSHEGQQGQDGQGQGEGQAGDPNAQPGEGQQPGQSLAERQRALRNELQRQQEGLPGLGGEAGRATREALDRAGRAMDRAEDALREDDLAGALDDQGEAMDALREGMRNLGEALAEQQQNQGQQGEAVGEANPSQQRDPLGRERSGQGTVNSPENMLPGADVYGRARELLDELRRRSSEQDRPDLELDYLERLLDRF